MNTIIASSHGFCDRRSLVTLCVLFCVSAVNSIVSGQQPPIHYFHRADMAPGAVGAGQLMRGGPLRGYFQPVEIRAPKGAEIALAVDGVFDQSQPNPLLVGLLVGRVYRLKVINIPTYEGREVFPSIEIINRLYPPLGQERRFPIPIQLTREELEMAMHGHFVTRVIYLEDPRRALPRREDPQHQRYFDVGAHQDPLRVADELGRPMAILRIGSRVPEADLATGRFLFDSPPWMRLPAPTPSGTTTPTPSKPRRENTVSYEPPARNRSGSLGTARSRTTATAATKGDNR